MANECTWAPALSAPKGLLVLCTSVCACTCLQCNLGSAIGGKVPVVSCRSRLYSTMSRYLPIV